MVPEGWELRRIGELVKRIRKPVSVESEATYQQIGIRSHAKGIFYKEPVIGEKLGNKKVFWIEPDCFIVNIVFAWERAIAATSKNERGMIASHRFPMFKPDEKNLCLAYLTRYFQTPQGQDALNLVSPGGAGRNKTLDQTAFLKLFIPVPPINEQKKIAEILGSVDDAIAATQAVIDQTRKVKQGILQQLLTCGIGHTKFKETAIGLIPENWEQLAIGDLTISHSYGPRFNSKSYDEDGNVRTIRGTDVTEAGEILYEQVPTALLEQELINQHTLRTGDLIVITTADCGRSAIFEEQSIAYIPSAYAVRYRFKGTVYPDFIKYFMHTRTAQRQVEQSIRKGTVANLPGSDVLKFKILFPPLEEQKKIVAVLKNLDETITTAQATIDQILNVKQGLMQDLLTGRVRVADC